MAKGLDSISDRNWFNAFVAAALIQQRRTDTQERRRRALFCWGAAFDAGLVLC